MPELSEEDIQSLYMWIDEIPLSRPKRNMTRDFGDGVLTAEVVKHYLPKLIDLHNYSPANSVSQKVYNWTTLNQKVFRRLGYNIGDEIILAIVNNKAGYIEYLLFELRQKIEEYLLHKPVEKPRRALSKSSSSKSFKSKQSEESGAEQSEGEESQAAPIRGGQGYPVKPVEQPQYVAQPHYGGPSGYNQPSSQAQAQVPRGAGKQQQPASFQQQQQQQPSEYQPQPAYQQQSQYPQQQSQRLQQQPQNPPYSYDGLQTGPMPDQSLPPNTIKPRSKKASKNHVVIREPQRPVHKSHVAPYPQPDYQPRIQPALPPTMGQSAMPSDAFAAEFRETLQMMQLKIQKLETLVDLKDKHIAKLTRSG